MKIPRKFKKHLKQRINELTVQNILYKTNNIRIVGIDYVSDSWKEFDIYCFKKYRYIGFSFKFIYSKTKKIHKSLKS